MTRRRACSSLAALCAVAAFPAASAAAVPTGVVASESGTGLTVVRKADGTTSPLPAGSKVYFGDTLIVSPGASATLKLTVPPGKSADDTLVSLKPVKGAKPKVRMERERSYVLVTLTS
jgi:hypothetical protein